MESTWKKTNTTHGHGINSQYRPEHFKEWISREGRKQERQVSPERTFNERSSFHHSSLFFPIESEVRCFCSMPCGVQLDPELRLNA